MAKAKVREHSLYLPLVTGALAAGWPIYNIRDGSPGRKPFDIAGSTPLGRAVGMEVKVVRTGTMNLSEPVPWKLFEMHQIAWLKAIAQAGGAALVVLHWEIGGFTQVINLPTVAQFNHGIEHLPHWPLYKVNGQYCGWQEITKCLAVGPSQSYGGSFSQSPSILL